MAGVTLEIKLPSQRKEMGTLSIRKEDGTYVWRTFPHLEKRTLERRRPTITVLSIPFCHLATLLPELMRSSR
jgi:hypothetical protein